MNRYNIDKAFLYSLFTPILGVTQVNYAYNNVEAAKKIMRTDRKNSPLEIYRTLKMFNSIKVENKIV